jgi:hypothetical protein
VIDHNSELYKLGFRDAQNGLPKVIPEEWVYQKKLNYSAGWDAGQAYRSGDHDPLNTSERRVIYGEESDQV